jgi:hypothetical protein
MVASVLVEKKGAGGLGAERWVPSERFPSFGEFLCFWEDIVGGQLFL